MGVRSDTKAALTAALRSRITDPKIGVDRSFPGPNMKPDHVWLDRVEGEGSLPFIEAGRHEREDSFRVLIEIAANRPGQTADAAEDACETLMLAVLDAIAEATLPGGLLAAVDDLTSVEPGQTNGPDAEPTQEGWVAYGEVEVAFNARTQ